MPRQSWSDEPRRAGRGSSWSTITPCSGPGCGPNWARPSRSSARPTRSGRHRAHQRTGARRRPARRPPSRWRGPGRPAGVTPHHPEVQFLALSVSDAPEDVIAVIRSGARGYVTKTISGDELLQAVYRVGAGDAVFSPASGRLRPGRLRRRVRAPWSPASIPSSTSCRPASARCCASSPAGYTYKEVARDLTISAKTVESHVSSVLRKLQLSTRHELTKWATDRRLV